MKKTNYEIYKYNQQKQNELNNLENRINQLEEENANLKMKLIEKEKEIKILKSNINNNINKIKKYENEIETIKNNNNLIKYYKNYKNSGDRENFSKIISLLEELKIKDKKINELEKGENFMPIIFTSVDSKIHYAFICKNTDKFNIIENKLYEVYPEYQETENFFTVNGNKIIKSKTMEENNIKYSDIIILNTYEM